MDNASTSENSASAEYQAAASRHRITPSTSTTDSVEMLGAPGSAREVIIEPGKVTSSPTLAPTFPATPPLSSPLRSLPPPPNNIPRITDLGAQLLIESLFKRQCLVSYIARRHIRIWNGAYLVPPAVL
ncbi:predicted protein [Uncinocarpus reesii 1704]|uniref:Uncharacterized protein n=1 Tax=Uncinocarpus reesii (strain UAMH 1704) TaxID=336963 RepID=C4JTR4_UNCRE|nr:uncharacterized protein UREG_05853 [Uncinocarpus reesii 1704]EEP81011.1 predicted protein [Uncinocarpus reesii 1704]